MPRDLRLQLHPAVSRQGAICTALGAFARPLGPGAETRVRTETVAFGDFHGILRIADGSPQCWQLLYDAVARPFALAAAAVAPVKPFAPAAILGHLDGTSSQVAAANQTEISAAQGPTIRRGL